jgi:hypothetical protein
LGNRKRFALIVSLPKNTVELAAAALDGGADALKLHINVDHRASGTHFGTFSEEREHLRAIARLAKGRASLGIMPGAESIASLEELEELATSGYEFLDCYIHHFPARYLSYKGLKKLLAVGSSYRPEDVPGLTGLGAEALEASVIEPEGYGRPLMTEDLSRYRWLSKVAKRPVVVPTQRKILPEEVASLASAGVSGIMIGAIVTGQEPDSVKKTTARFRESIDSSLEAG